MSGHFPFVLSLSKHSEPFFSNLLAITSVLSGRRIAIAALLLLALFVRLQTLDQRPLWYDELYTQRIAKYSAISEVWRAAERDGAQHPPLYYLLARGALSFGDGAGWLRLPSLISGVLAVWGVVLLGGALIGWWGGIVAGMLLAFSVYAIEYSQEARSYMLLVCEGIYLHYFLLRYCRTGFFRHLLLGALMFLAALYTHHLALFFLPSMGWLICRAVVCRDLEVITSQRGRYLRSRRRIVEIAATFLAVLALYYPQLSNTQLFLSGQYLVPQQTLVISPQTLSEVSGRWGNSSSWSWLYLSLLFLGIVPIIRQGGGFLVLWLVSPFLCYYLVPFSKFFDIRFLMPALAPFYILVASGTIALARVADKVALRVRGRTSITSLVPSLVLVMLLVGLSLSTYREFIRLKVRCSNFAFDPKIISIMDGFCAKHLILNSLNPTDRYLLKTQDSKRGE